MNNFRVIKSRVMGLSMRAISLLIILLALMIGIGLYMKSAPILHKTSLLTLITSSEWKPLKGQFGLLPFVMGTLWVTGIAIVISLPLCLLTSIYLGEYASEKVKALINPVIDLLAGIPPVIYGVWGVLVI